MDLQIWEAVFKRRTYITEKQTKPAIVFGAENCFPEIAHYFATCGFSNTLLCLRRAGV